MEYLRKAVAQIKMLGIPATPVNYSIWYAYFSGKKPELTQAIVDHSEQGFLFTVEFSRSLYEQFFDSGAERQLIEIRDAINLLIKVLSEHLSELDHGLEDYEQVLKSCEARLQQDPDIDTLNQLVGSLVLETMNSREANKKAQQNISLLNNEIEEMKLCLKRLSEEALEDDLTGVANRRAFDRTLEELILEANTSSEPEHCLLLLDIDHFKLVNDKFGHVVGDRVLRFVAQMIKRNIKGGDFVARFGGEEFAVLFPNTNAKGGMSIANEIIQTVANQKLTLNKQALTLGKVTLSGGLSIMRRGDTTLSIVERADNNLYQAKTNGRNIIVGEVGI